MSPIGHNESDLIQARKEAIENWNGEDDKTYEYLQALFLARIADGLDKLNKMIEEKK